MKKIYLKPDIKIVDIKLTQLLIASEPEIPVDTDPNEFIDNPNNVW